MLITKEFIESGMSRNGAWNKAQMDALGVKYEFPFHLPHKWKRKLVGKEISDSQAKKFIDLIDAHLSYEPKTDYLEEEYQRMVDLDYT